MSERRDFLRAASLLPLVVSDSIASTASPQGPAPAPAGTPPATPAGGSQINLPKLPPVAEQPFRDYHLLGRPEPNGNLLGATRPHDWQSTKDELASALRETAQESDPIHAWLHTFRLTFDDRATAIVRDAAKTLRKVAGGTELKYEPQLYDASLRSASALLDRCLRYRNEMGGFEMSGVNAGISYLTFLKVKPLQRNLIIHSSGADVTEIERITQAAASHRYGEARGIDKLFDKYHLQGLQIETEGGAAEAGLASEKDRLCTHLLERQFHVQIDAQLAQFTRLLSPGSASNFAERYLRMHALLTEDLADAYRKLYSAAKGIQQVLAVAKVTPGNGSPVNVDIPEFTAPELLKDWVRQMIPPQEGDQRKPDVLDALVIWTRAVMREIDTRAQYETEFTVSIPLSQPWGSSKVPIPINGSVSGTATFTLAPTALPFPPTSVPTNIRMVGFGLSVEHSNDDASPPQYAKPYPATLYNSHDPNPSDAQKDAVRTIEMYKMARLNAYVKTPLQTVQGVGSYNRPALYLSNVRIQGGMGGDMEPNLSYDPGCRNLSPFGDWTISLDPNILAFYQSASPLLDDWVSGLILHMRLRGTSTTV